MPFEYSNLQSGILSLFYWQKIIIYFYHFYSLQNWPMKAYFALKILFDQNIQLVGPYKRSSCAKIINNDSNLKTEKRKITRYESIYCSQKQYIITFFGLIFRRNKKKLFYIILHSQSTNLK